MTRSGAVTLAALSALALHAAPTSAAPPPVPVTTQARLSIKAVEIPVTYVGGLGSNNAVSLGPTGKTGTRSKSPGRLDFLTLTLSHARSDDYFLQWRQDVVAGRAGYKRNVTLALLDAGGAVQCSFNLTNAWPSQYAVSALSSSQGTQKAPSQEGETITLAYENLARVK